MRPDEDIGLADLVRDSRPENASEASRTASEAPEGHGISRDGLQPGSPPSRSEAELIKPVRGDDSVRSQQWLLVLRLVRQGVYAMLSKEYENDVKHIRYIIGLSSANARHELTTQTLLAMNEEEQRDFERTVERIHSNLSVQRNARDLEIYEKVCEIQHTVESYLHRQESSGDYSTL